MNNIELDDHEFVISLDLVRMDDVHKVGGKNASLGEMISQLKDLGVNVPSGFATTSDAFNLYLSHNNLHSKINACIDNLDIDNIESLASTGSEIRSMIIEGQFPPIVESVIRDEFVNIIGSETTVAVRSSATAEDLPDASFAGQQETFLNVHGIESVLLKIKEVYASLYNDRAISYRVHKNYKHHEVSLSACVQTMVRSDMASSGVMFSLDTESGFSDVVFITSNYGLGETVVQGSINPDEFYVSKLLMRNNKPSIISRSLGSKNQMMVYCEKNESKNSGVKLVDVERSKKIQFSIGDEYIVELAKIACIIEQHYKMPMDIEWAIDGLSGDLFIVQARPETALSNSGNAGILERYVLSQSGNVIVSGAAIGNKIGSGTCKVMKSLSYMKEFTDGDVLITTMTDPDWEPIMEKASAIITERGGRTCHAAIIARELGVPAIVGCGEFISNINDGDMVTASCAEGEVGNLYAGLLPYAIEKTELDGVPKLPVKVMMNIGNPGRAMSFSKIPNDGIGLARLEFIINNKIGIHPRALLEFDQLDSSLQQVILDKISAYKNPIDFYVTKIIEGVSTIASVFSNSPVIVRFSDFKSNEYANLIGGNLYEPKEENPMLGYRGTSRFLSKDFESCFELECRALKYVREKMGLTNIWLMAPFVRTLDEAKSLNLLLEKFGLRRGENDLKLIMMCELPSNAILADEFLTYFDGFSIGSNDMTQLTLGLDRDSALVSGLFDERNDAVKFLLKRAISACQKAGKYVGICGQGPSDHPEFAKWLLDQGIDSISLNPDSVIETAQAIAKS
jgi:pyruvate,water dikinase